MTFVAESSAIEVESTWQKCAQCGSSFPAAFFPPKRGGKCRACVNAYHREWRAKNSERSNAASRRWKARNPEYAKERHLRKTYGLTSQDIENLRLDQLDLCGICREPLRDDACVDHDHKTGEIRGLLHRKCNAALGGFRDDYHLVQLAALYLHRTRKDSVHPWAVIGDPPEHRDWRPGVKTFYPEIDPTARLNSFVSVDAGLYEPTRVGARSFLLTKSHVGHDAQIGVDCELAPGTVIGGHVVLEDGVRCGIGVLIKPGVRVGAGARLGAGAVVVKNVPPGETWVGNPARQLLPAPLKGDEAEAARRKVFA